MPNTATLTKAMLADMMKGNASISLLACPADGQVTLSSMDFSSADQIFSVKNSFQLQPTDPTKTDLQIDQMDEIVDSTYTEGDYTMVANIPSQAEALLNYFYNAGATVTGVKGQDGSTTYAGKGYLDRKEVYCSVLVESASKKTAVLFARVRVTVNPPQNDDTDNPAYLRFNGVILANLKANEGNFSVLKKATTPEPSGD